MMSLPPRVSRDYLSYLPRAKYHPLFASYRYLFYFFNIIGIIEPLRVPHMMMPMSEKKTVMASNIQ